MRFYSQSDSTKKSLRQHGCGAYSAVNALVWATGGEWKPDSHTASAQHRVDASGVSDADFNRRGLTSTELATSLHAVKATEQRMDLPVQQRRGTSVMGQLVPFLIRFDAAACVAVDYGVVVDAGHGKTKYRGGHWVLVFQPDLGDDEVTVMDPLRSQTTTWPLPLLVKAMESFGTKPWLRGRGEAVVIGQQRTWREGYGVVKAQRDECRAGK